MQKLLKILLVLTLSHSAHAAGMAEIVKNVREVCLTPSEQGKYWNVSATGGAKADGTIKLIAAGINGQATFTKGEWDGVQQVLQKDQLDDNKRYTHCVEHLTPLFINKFATAPAAPPKSAAQPAAKATVKTNTSKPKSATAAKPAATSTPAPAATEPDVEQSTETTGTITGDQNVTGNNAGGDMNINFGTKP